jgi:hypothetical protein
LSLSITKSYEKTAAQKEAFGRIHSMVLDTHI